MQTNRSSLTNKHNARGGKRWHARSGGVAVATPLVLGMIGLILQGATAQAGVPSITTQPLSQVGIIAQSATFSVAAAGDPPLSYQWWKDGQALLPESRTNLTLNSLHRSAAGNYSVVVSNSSGTATSAVAVLSIASIKLSGYNSWLAQEWVVPYSNVVGIVFNTGSGYGFGLGLCADGSVFGVGDNRNGQCDVPTNIHNAVAVAAGGAHSLALKADGTLAAWGSNSEGECNIPAGLSNVVAIAAGDFSSMALRADGTVVGWGTSRYGQCSVPAGLSDVVAICAGAWHNLAIRADGSVVSWGRNDVGQATVPVGLANVVAVAAASQNNLALLADGSVKGWNYSNWPCYNPTNIPPDLTGVVAVAAGGTYGMALRADGKVTTWGCDYWGERAGAEALSNVVQIAACGSLNMCLTEVVTTPPQILLQPVRQDLHTGMKARLFTLARGTPPMGYQWRCNGTNIAGATTARCPLVNVQPGQAGNYQVIVSNQFGAITSQVAVVSITTAPGVANLVQSQPAIIRNRVEFTAEVGGQPPLSLQWLRDGVPIPGANQSSFVLAAAQWADVASSFSVVVGNALGVVTSSVVRLAADPVVTWGLQPGIAGRSIPAGLGQVVKIACGNSHSLALRTDGTVVMWGSGTLGVGSVPAGLSNVVAIAAGGDASVALKSDGRVVSWGQWLDTTRLSNIVDIAVGGYFGASYVLALRANGTVVGVGPQNLDHAIPPGVSNVVSFAANGAVDLALTSDGRVVSLGGTNTGVPADLTNVAKVAVCGISITHGLALKHDGTVVSWGPTNLMAPVGLSNVVDVAIGANHCLALKADSTVVAWGSDYWAGVEWGGQTRVPTGLTNVVAIACGYNYSLALTDYAFVQGRLQFPRLTRGFTASTPTIRGRSYRLEYTESLLAPNWTPLPAAPGDDTLKALTDPAASGLQRFYRLMTPRTYGF